VIDMLDIDNISKRFGGVHALREVSLSVPPGGRVGVVGANGAGKTTLINIITRKTAPDSGDVRFGGVSILTRPDHGLAALGIRRTFQQARLFGHLTAKQNILVGRKARGDSFLAEMFSRSRVAREEHQIWQEARALWGRLGMNPVAADSEIWHQQDARLLSPGQQRLTELAMVLVPPPRLVILDEPSVGLAPVHCDGLKREICRLAGEGAAFLIISHDMTFLSGTVDRLFQIRNGQLISCQENIRADSNRPDWSHV
jgi:branched-chain amino acid transport system ATP-binding protein